MQATTTRLRASSIYVLGQQKFSVENIGDQKKYMMNWMVTSLPINDCPKIFCHQFINIKRVTHMMMIKKNRLPGLKLGIQTGCTQVLHLGSDFLGFGQGSKKSGSDEQY